MNPTHLCPQCQAALSANAPEGLCPQCLLKAAAGSPSVGDIIDIGDPAEVAKCFPQFEILELLGRGGMGVVYKARQVQLDRIVALKILPPVDALSPDFVARFTREARSLARLTHANIVAIYDFGESGGLYYFSMEFVDGVNLRALLAGGKVAPAQALAIVPLVCDALAYAHEEGIVHRDIKPENILLDKKGRVKIADFGLAKLLRREPLELTLTLTGVTLGTVRYMAPEQMDKPETVDHRADIYSLGVVIYEMLTGDVPMGRFAPPSQKSGVDVRLDEIILHALEREPAQRYQQVSEMKTDVENVTSGPAAPAPAAAEAGQFSGEPRFSRFAIVGAVWAVFGVVAIISGMIFVALSHVWDGTASPTALIYERPPAAFTIFMAALLAIGAGAPIGTPIYGVIAIRHIRRSGGKIVGLLLAVADVLLFPLLLLDVLVCTMVGATVEFIVRNTPGGHIGAGELLVIELLAALAVDFFIARAVWRNISGTTPARASDGAGERVGSGDAVLDPRKKVQTPADTLLLVAGISLLTALGVAGWLWANSTLHPEGNFHPGRGQQGVMIIAMSVTLAIHAVFIGAAGLLMRRLCARFFVLVCVVLAGLFLPAVLALNCIMEAKNIPQWPIFITTWLGMPVCVWAALLLFREDVREAFAKVSAAAPSLEASPGSWTPLEMAAIATTALAFLFGGVNALFDLVKNASPLHTATLSAIIAAAACSAALMIVQQLRQPAIARAALPGLHFTVLAACTGSLPWTWVFGDITGWNFWHGAAFAALNFVLALVLLITAGERGAVWRGASTLLAGLAGFALVLWWNVVPVRLIGGSEWITSITRKPALYGAWIAVTLAVLTAIAGALQLRRALAPRA